MSENIENNNMNDETFENIENNEQDVKNDSSEEIIFEVFEENEPKKKKSFIKELFDWVVSIAVALLIVTVLHLYVFVNVEVDGASMNSTLTHGDRLFVSRLFYTPKNSDIVVLAPTLKEGTIVGKSIISYNSKEKPLYIKRVIATEGQTIDIKDGRVYVDGALIDEPYLDEGVFTLEKSTELPLTVPKNCVFVMGDNRNNSSDSRDARVGIVRREQIVGKAVFRLLPLNKFGGIK
ncbi:MAG: signal peptidase I [Clostridia bacterium]|nr:signal peptidase I [Clostridia bacterium]